MGSRRRRARRQRVVDRWSRQRDRSAAALAANDQRLDRLSAELAALDLTDPDTRRAVRRRVLQREAKRQVRARRWIEARLAHAERRHLRAERLLAEAADDQPTDEAV